MAVVLFIRWVARRQRQAVAAAGELLANISMTGRRRRTRNGPEDRAADRRPLLGVMRDAAGGGEPLMDAVPPPTGRAGRVRQLTAPRSGPWVDMGRLTQAQRRT